MYKFRLLGIVFILIGIAVISYWILFLAQGKMANGIYTIKDDGYIIFHQYAELITAIICIATGISIFQEYPFAKILTGAAYGLLFYAGANTLGWRLQDDLFVSILLFGTVVFSTLGLFFLLREGLTSKT